MTIASESRRHRRDSNATQQTLKQYDIDMIDQSKVSRNDEADFGAAEIAEADRLIDQALAEDLGDRGDATGSALIPRDARGEAAIVARRSGIVAGLPVVELLAKKLDLELKRVGGFRDGARVEPGKPVAILAGAITNLLIAERTALNFLQRLSGIASLTDRFVAAIAGTKARILDTRKTTPAHRRLEKYAVRKGGGTNHRFGLFDAILIKDNHLAWLGDGPNAIEIAVKRARESAPAGMIVEIEVDSLDQFDRAIYTDADIILIDNFSLMDTVEAVRRLERSGSRALIEASGGISLENVAAIAATGIDRISVGALTHSARALDLGLDFPSRRPQDSNLSN